MKKDFPSAAAYLITPSPSENFTDQIPEAEIWQDQDLSGAVMIFSRSELHYSVSTGWMIRRDISL